MENLFEALETIKIKCHPNSNPSPIVDEALETIEQALTELKAIKEAKPNEAIKCLEKLDDMFYMNGVREIASGVYEPHELSISETKEYDTIKNYILKAQELEKENAEYKKLLKVVWEKPTIITFAIGYIRITINPTYDDYCSLADDEHRLTEEEFELLKRWSGK